jgi:hypothetical protein
MQKFNLDNEVVERLKRRIKTKRLSLALGIFANVIGVIVLYYYYRVTRGLDYANENTFQYAAEFIAIEGIAVLFYSIYVTFIDIPNEILNETRIANKPKLDIPHFHASWHEGSIFVKDSNADKVASFFEQYLKDFPVSLDTNTFRVQIGKKYHYGPEYYNTINHIFVLSGTKQTYRPVKDKNASSIHTKELPEMFLIEIIQGGENKTQIKLRTDDNDIHKPFFRKILLVIKDSFLISKTAGMPEEPEIVFPNLVISHELIIETATPEQVMTFIKNSISSTLWYLHVDNAVAYDVSQDQTRFYYPEKDNTSIHGIIFAGVKYDLEQKPGGILNRKNAENISSLFAISISPAGLGENTKLLLKFDTQFQDAGDFFNKWVKNELKKVFQVKEKRKSRIV